MLILTFRVGGERYGIPTRQVVEVSPLVNLRKMPQAPGYVLGVCNYRGRIAPVIDLGLLMVNIASRPLFSTRIMFVEKRSDREIPEVVGLVAEGVTETLEVEDDAIEDASAVRSPTTPYLGPVLQHEVGLIQMFDLRLLDAPTHAIGSHDEA